MELNKTIISNLEELVCLPTKTKDPHTEVIALTAQTLLEDYRTSVANSTQYEIWKVELEDRKRLQAEKRNQPFNWKFWRK